MPTNKTNAKKTPPCWRATKILAALEVEASKLSRGGTVLGPVTSDELPKKRGGVYLIFDKHPGGWWRPAKGGEAGDLEDRGETLCAEGWCELADDFFFAILTPGLGQAGRVRLEARLKKEFGLAEVGF